MYKAVTPGYTCCYGRGSVQEVKQTHKQRRSANSSDGCSVWNQSEQCSVEDDDMHAWGTGTGFTFRLVLVEKVYQEKGSTLYRLYRYTLTINTNVNYSPMITSRSGLEANEKSSKVLKTRE